MFDKSSPLPNPYVCVQECNDKIKKLAPALTPPGATHKKTSSSVDCTAFVVVLENDRLVALKKDWVQNPILNSVTKVFYSPNTDDSSNFELHKMYYFNEKNGFLLYRIFVQKIR